MANLGFSKLRAKIAARYILDSIGMGAATKEPANWVGQYKAAIAELLEH